jgi:hypothetical protein
MAPTIIVFCCLVLLLFALYYLGVISVDVKRSTMYIGTMRGDRALFRSCTGYTRRRLRFREASTVTFTLNLALTAGSVSLEITDGSRTLLQLDGQNPSGAITVPAGSACTQIIRFDGASGEYTIVKA